MNIKTDPTKNQNTLTSHDIEELTEVINELPLAIKTRVRLSKIFTSLHKKMNEGISHEEILNSLFTSLHNVIPFDRLGIALLENHDTIIRIDWVKSIPPEKWLTENFSESIKSSLLREVIETDAPIIINDFKEYSELHPNFETVKLMLLDGMRSALSCPLRIEGRPIGTISFSSSAPNTYNHSHIDIFSEISYGLSVVVEKKLLKNSIAESNLKESIFKSAIHDLNNPLNIIHASLSLIEKRPSYQELGVDNKKLFQMLKRNCDSMISIIYSLIYDKNKTEMSPYEDSKQSLYEFISEVASECEILGKKKDIDTIVVIGPDIPLNVVINYVVIKNVIHNLISNAIKFSPRGKKVVARADFNKAENRLYFTVTDEGPGIPKEEQILLFKQFGKTSVQPTAGEPSGGLGLANVKQLVESQNGQAFVNSRVGEGSTFGFWIPIEIAKE